MADSSNSRDEMHRQVSWMVSADVSILEYLYSSRTKRGSPSIQTPRTIHANTGYSRSHASTRCQVLAEHGLVEQTGKGFYRLTEFGELLLEDEISLSELEPDRARGE